MASWDGERRRGRLVQDVLGSLCFWQRSSERSPRSPGKSGALNEVQPAAFLQRHLLYPFGNNAPREEGVAVLIAAGTGTG